MSLYVNDNNVWKNTIQPYVNDNGIWKKAWPGDNIGNAGYFGGGSYSDSYNFFSTIDKLTFASDSALLLSVRLSQTKYGLGACNSTVNGYFGSGYTYYYGDVFFSTIDKLIFTSELVSILSAKLLYPNFGLAACNSSTNGYFGGGWQGSTLCLSIIDKLAFLSESVSISLARLLQTKLGLAACQQGDFY